MATKEPSLPEFMSFVIPSSPICVGPVTRFGPIRCGESEVGRQLSSGIGNLSFCHSWDVHSWERPSWEPVRRPNFADRSHGKNEVLQSPSKQTPPSWQLASPASQETGSHWISSPAAVWLQACEKLGVSITRLSNQSTALGERIIYIVVLTHLVLGWFVTQQ